MQLLTGVECRDAQTGHGHAYETMGAVWGNVTAGGTAAECVLLFTLT